MSPYLYKVLFTYTPKVFTSITRANSFQLSHGISIFPRNFAELFVYLSVVINQLIINHNCYCKWKSSQRQPWIDFSDLHLLSYQLLISYLHNTTTTIILRPLSGTTRVSRYQNKHWPIHHPDHHPIFISFLHLLRSIASSLFKLCAWQSLCTTSPCPLWSTSWSRALHHMFHTFVHPINQCLLFAIHAHTIATCFAVVSISYLFLVFLSTPYLELYLLP